MKTLTLTHFITCFYTTEEQAQIAGVTRGTYCNAYTGPAHKRYRRRVLFTLIKDLAHEEASDPRNADYYKAAIRQSQRFIDELRKPAAGSAGGLHPTGNQRDHTAEPPDGDEA